MKKSLTILFLFFAFISNAQTVSITSSASGSICAGTSVTFTATTTGYTTPTYQWYKNNVAISGATSSTYVTSGLINNDAIQVTAVEGGASVSTSGLVLNLDAANSSSYTSGATTWTDLTGKGNHGTLNNVTYSTSNQGYLSFNGTTSYVSLPNSTDFNFGTGDFTIELWAQNSSATKTPNLLAINSNNSFYSAVRIGWAPNINGNPTVTLNHSTNGTSWSVQTGYTGSFSSWTQIVLSRTAGVVTIYANGVNKGTYNLAGSLMTTTTSTPIYNQIGTLPNWQSVYTLLGNMSIVRYYKAAGLTSSQVISNYNAICSRYGLSAIGTTSNSITTSVTAGPTVNLTLSGDGCVNKSMLSASSGLSSYAWYKDDAVISGATTTTYSPTESGNYKVAVSNGTCSTASAATTIYTCGVTADGKMISTTFSAPLVSSEGGANFGTTMDDVGKILNATGLTTTTGSIAATTAVLGGIISATNAVTSSIGVIYSRDANFGTYSSSTIQSNVAAGTYTTTITGLTSETTYYTKSFVVNKAGTSYGPVVSFTTPVRPIAIGDSYGGGIVAYVYQNGDPGYSSSNISVLIAASVDQGTSRWYNGSNISTGAIATSLGSGSANTNAIITSQGAIATSYAAGKASAYSDGTYTDWYLPSQDELNKLYLNRNTIGGFAGKNYFWTSTESSADTAKMQNFLSGGAISDFPKSASGGYIRAVRTMNLAP